MKPTRSLFQPLLLLTLLLVAGSFTNRAYAQYQSFFGDSITEYDIGTFSIMYDPNFFGRETQTLIYDADDTVVFNGRTYLKPTYENSYYLREDTTLGKLYRYDFQTDTEYLICDMSLEMGDTFAFPSKYHEPGTMSIGGIVDSVVYLNGKKVITFRTDTASNNPCNDEPLLFFFENAAYEEVPIMFIDGIGPNYFPGWMDDYFYMCDGGLFIDYMGAWTWNFNYPLLLCVHKDGEQTYMADERAGCYQYVISVKEKDLGELNVYPNPVKNTLNIEFENMPTQKGTLYITDIAGRVVYSQKTSEQYLKVNVKRFQSGLYVATWIGDGKKQSVKFVKK